jgi:putative ABC transport system substrate-binding protein
MLRVTIAAVLLGLLAMPLAAAAPPAGKVYRIGLLSPISSSPPLDGFREGLRGLGYVEGQNIVIEHRSAEGKFERLPELAAELVRLQPDVIVAVVTQASLAAKHATRTIPIVMVAVGDPVGAGLVASLARPGGNVTGTSALSVELAGKSLEALKQVVPKLHRVAALWNPANPVFQAQMVRQMEAAALVDRILKGANPADLPVEQTTQYGLVINRRTARALGLTIPEALSARAERIIE